MPKLASTARDAIAHLDEVNRGARDFVEALEPVVLDYCVGLASQPYSCRSAGAATRTALTCYRIVGMTNSAPSLVPEGQREVTVLVLV